MQRRAGSEAMPPSLSPDVISPLIPADDFARQLSVDELYAAIEAAAEAGRALVCSLTAAPEHRPDALGADRVGVVGRELALLLRRNLRGSDAVAVERDELLLLLDVGLADAPLVAERLLTAARNHTFTTGGAAPLVRLSVSIGIACAPEHGERAADLIASARRARSRSGHDSVAIADEPLRGQLDLARFVGRAEELSELVNYLDDALRGVGHVVGLVGESGVGTSTLARMLEPELRMRGGSMIVGRCRRQSLPDPYALWVDVLRSVRRLPVKTTRQWRELPLLDRALDPGELPVQGGSKTRLLEELADFLRLAAQQRPLVLVLEDVQWADEASWDALEYLAAQFERERILMVLTVADHAPEHAIERWRRLKERPRHREVVLSRLTRDDVKRWLEGAVHTAELNREIVSYAYRVSSGRPLALLHVLRDLEESGYLEYDGESWCWRAVSGFPAPATLDELLQRRLERLSAGTRRTLEFAALLDAEADQMLLASVPEGTAEPGELRHLVTAGYLVPTLDRGRRAFLVAHDEVARVVREGIPAERLNDLHTSAAEALVRRERGADAEIAAHFEAGGDQARAHVHALRAADHSQRVHEAAALRELLAAAVRTAPDEASRAEALVRMATAAKAAGRYDEAESLCDEALTWFTEQHDSVRILSLKLMRAEVRMKRGLGAQATLTEALALEEEARAANADLQRVAILLFLARIHWRLGDVRAAQRVAEEAVQIAERHDDHALISDARNRFAVTIQLEDPARSRALYYQTLDLAIGIGDTFRHVRALNNIGVLELIESRWDAARDALRAAVELSRTAGLLEEWGRAELNLGVLEGRNGDFEKSAHSLSEALRLTAMVQNSEEQLYATYNMAHLERERGRYREASDTYTLVTELAERIGQAEVQVGAIAGAGLCAFLQGELELAREAQRVYDPLMQNLVVWFQGRELIEALDIHLLLEGGATDAAVTRFEQALRLAAPGDVYGAAWLTAEFGARILPTAPEVVRSAATEYGGRREILANENIRSKLAVLKVDS